MEIKIIPLSESNPRVHMIHKVPYEDRKSLTSREIYEKKQASRRKRLRECSNARQEYYDWLESILHRYGIYTSGKNLYREDRRAAKLIGISQCMAKNYRLRIGHFPSQRTHNRLLELAKSSK